LSGVIGQEVSTSYLDCNDETIPISLPSLAYTGFFTTLCNSLIHSF
jgi:hypothetical protein